MKNEVQCYAHLMDSNAAYSDDWLRSVLQCWIGLRTQLLDKRFPAEEFRARLKAALVVLADWESQFREAYANAGGQPGSKACTKAYLAYVAEHDDDILRMVPYGAHAEFRWIPGWNGRSLDDAIETHGMRSDRYRSTYLEDLQPDAWLTRFLQLVNVGTDALQAAARATRGAEGEKFAQRIDAAQLFYGRDPSRPSLMSPEQVIAVLENGYINAVPVVHAEIEVRALLELDPTQPFVLSTAKKGEVHVGFHCFVNGAGYLDTYPGQVVVGPAERGFSSDERWSYGINKVYGLYRPAFYTTPKAL